MPVREVSPEQHLFRRKFSHLQQVRACAPLTGWEITSVCGIWGLASSLQSISWCTFIPLGSMLLSLQLQPAIIASLAGSDLHEFYLKAWQWLPLGLQNAYNSQWMYFYVKVLVLGSSFLQETKTATYVRRVAMFCCLVGAHRSLSFKYDSIVVPVHTLWENSWCERKAKDSSTLENFLDEVSTNQGDLLLPLWCNKEIVQLCFHDIFKLSI